MPCWVREVKDWAEQGSEPWEVLLSDPWQEAVLEWSCLSFPSCSGNFQASPGAELDLGTPGSMTWVRACSRSCL